MAKRTKQVSTTKPVKRTRMTKHKRQLLSLEEDISDLRRESMQLQSNNAQLRGAMNDVLERAGTAERAVKQMERRITKMVNAKEAAIDRLKSQINGLLWVLMENPDAVPDTLEKS
jgi:predicted  nucleic acid-binding Zn-ribbon protein